MMGFVYVLEGAGLYKIGGTNNLERRLEALQTGSPVRLSFVRTIEAYKYLELESRIQKRFQSKKVLGIGNEWFQLTEQDLEWIETVDDLLTFAVEGWQSRFDEMFRRADTPAKRRGYSDIFLALSEPTRQQVSALMSQNGKKGGRPKLNGKPGKKRR